MKIIHLTGKDYYGAGRAAYRLHSGLRQAGIDSVMLVGDKRSDDPAVVNIQKGWLWKYRKKLLVRLEKYWIKKEGKTPDGMFSSGMHGLSIAKKVNALAPDLIHIHWINRGFMRLSDLKALKAPIIVTMHDMWYFTGGCHVNNGCAAYYSLCGACPQLHSDNSYDLSRTIQAFKKEIYNKLLIRFIAPSAWMNKEARQSGLLGKSDTVHLANGIDTERFVFHKGAREQLNLPLDKKLVLFAAVDATSDLNKGFKFLTEAVAFLDPNEFELIIIGGNKEDQFDKNLLIVHNVGYLDSDNVLIDYLSAADVVVVPSRQENLSNMIMEALACSTPVVAFDVGGNADMVKHQVNGYLASPFNCKELFEGIVWCTENKGRNEKLAISARKTVEEKFSLKAICQEHITLYKRIQEEQHDQ